MKEYICEKCDYVCGSPSALLKHLKRKTPCNEGRLRCDGCGHRCDDASNMRKHKKICKGAKISIKSKQNEIENYQTILAATGNQRNAIDNSQASTSNHYGDVICGDQINNIQNNNNNIIVLPACKEDIDHIKQLSPRELMEKIGFNTDISPHLNFFKMVRADETHPENNTMLLPSQDCQTIHYKSEDGWKTGRCEEQLYKAIFTDNRTLIQDFSRIEKSHPNFYNSHLLQTVNQMINNNDTVGLQPYYDAYREALHQLTIRLADKHGVQDINVNDINVDSPEQNENHATIPSSVKELLDLELAKQKTHEMNQRTLELEIEKLKLERQKSAISRES